MIEKERRRSNNNSGIPRPVKKVRKIQVEESEEVEETAHSELEEEEELSYEESELDEAACAQDLSCFSIPQALDSRVENTSGFKGMEIYNKNRKVIVFFFFFFFF
jgi:hypothetical protein